MDFTVGSYEKSKLPIDFFLITRFHDVCVIASLLPSGLIEMQKKKQLSRLNEKKENILMVS